MSSTYVAYRADSVGPVVKNLVKEHDGLVAVHEDAIDSSKLLTAKPGQQVQPPTPPDPLVDAWRAAAEAASDFTNIRPTRDNVALHGITDLIAKLDAVRGAATKPAPVAPPPVVTPGSPPSVLIRWGSRVDAKADIEINSSDSVTLARDKKGSRQHLTGLAPTTWYRESDVRTPCVVRPRRHHAGKKFFVCNSAAEVRSAILKCGPGWYATTLVDKASEYRVFVLQDRVIRISTKSQRNVGEVAWNVGRGASAAGLARKNWPINVAKAALAAARKLNLDWAAVDVCVDKQGNALVLEANTAPGLQNGSRALEQIAWAFAWVGKNPKPQALNLSAVSTWQELLHPSLAQAADA